MGKTDMSYYKDLLLTQVGKAISQALPGKPKGLAEPKIIADSLKPKIVKKKRRQGEVNYETTGKTMSIQLLFLRL